MESTNFLEALLQEVAVEQHNAQLREDNRVLILPLSLEEKAQKCASCHHLLRYHMPAKIGGKCKYQTCATRCRGFVQYKPKGEKQ
jgi:hypothetical protein